MTILPAAAGYWLVVLDSPTEEAKHDNIIDFQKTLLATCVGVLINSVFLYSWKVSPRPAALSVPDKKKIEETTGIELVVPFICRSFRWS